jgi:hypothetical protein
MNETGDIDSLAAEYVLGTLDANERAQTQALLTVDQALAAKVRIWERRLSELHLMVEPIEPENEIWDRIRHKVPRPAPPVPPPPAPAPVIASAAAIVAATPPAPEPTPEPEPVIVRTPPPLPASPDPWPSLTLDRPVRAKDRPSLESLEEAVLKAADDLQRRATAEPVKAPEPEPVVERDETIAPAASGPAEADGKTPEVAGSAPEETAKSTEEGPKTEETPAPVTAADEQPSPTGVFDDLPEPKLESKPESKPEPKLPDPLAAFPTSFAASAPAPAPAPLVPSPSSTFIAPAPPPVPPPTPSVPVLRPENRRSTPAPKSHWLARTVAPLATLILLAVVGLVAAWRFAPEHVPQHLRPIELLRAAGIAVPTTVVAPPPRKPAPPESQYDE